MAVNERMYQYKVTHQEQLLARRHCYLLLFIFEITTNGSQSWSYVQSWAIKHQIFQLSYILLAMFKLDFVYRPILSSSYILRKYGLWNNKIASARSIMPGARAFLLKISVKKSLFGNSSTSLSGLLYDNNDMSFQVVSGSWWWKR